MSPERTRFVTIHFAPAPQRLPSDPKVSRFLAVVIALICGAWIFGYGSDSEAQYWLHKDARQGEAEVTKALWTGHNSVTYRYAVEGVHRRQRAQLPRVNTRRSGIPHPIPGFQLCASPNPHRPDFLQSAFLSCFLSFSSKPAPSSPSSPPLIDGPSTSTTETSSAPAAARRALKSSIVMWETQTPS